MADDVDIASDYTSEFVDNAIKQQAADIPKGKPGECIDCGYDFPRLIKGMCVQCREFAERVSKVNGR